MKSHFIVLGKSLPRKKLINLSFSNKKRKLVRKRLPRTLFELVQIGKTALSLTCLVGVFNEYEQYCSPFKLALRLQVLLGNV